MDDISTYLRALCVAGCVFILLQNTSRYFSRPLVFHFLLDLNIRAILSFMATGGLIIFAKCCTKITFFRTYEDNVPSDLVETICSENSTNSTLPTAWFEEVNNEILAHNFERFEKYCLVVFVYAISFAALRKLWSIIEGGQVRELIPLVTSILLPSDNKKEREEAIVELMISKVRAHRNLFLYLVYVEIVCFLLGLLGLSNPVNFFQNQDLAVHLNGSEWTVNCDRQSISRSIFTLTKCQYNYTDGKFGSICIVPTVNVYFYLYYGSVALFGLLAMLSFLSVIPISLVMSSLPRMRDGMLMILLKKNVDYMQHMEIIDALEKKLDARRRETTTPIEQSRDKNFMEDNIMHALGIFVLENWSWKQWWADRARHQTL
ncbi:hypothetical protein AVEN_26827-1 [Araneus ventricosus]|uniref:Innexin n=1 Tax=Araneus ventricosus TaxID=182803 RepID=A0A4Y2KHN6_ARAVE|nr:hypothetical protein AVEN_26827-1 [Araneus ventricosus]